MKIFLLLPLFIVMAFPRLPAQTQTADGGISILGFKWSKIHQTIDPGPDDPLPASAVTAADKNFNRTSRINDPAGRRDPNADTLDTRQAELEKNSRAAEKPGSKTINAFTYQAKIRNDSKQAIEVIFWEYQFVDPANAGNNTRRQFMCGVNLKPDKEKELQAFSVSGPPNAVDATGAGAAKPFQEKVIVNRIEYADGKSWMRKDWNANEIKAGYQKAMATPWSPNEMCRGL